jgi:hypothetical protein
MCGNGSTDAHREPKNDLPAARAAISAFITRR